VRKIFVALISFVIFIVVAIIFLFKTDIGKKVGAPVIKSVYQFYYRRPLHHFAGLRDLERVKFFVEMGFDVNAYDQHKMTPLHSASRRDGLDVVKFFVNKGADIKAVDASGSTALHYASNWGDFDIAKFLVDKGADLDAVNKFRATPLHIASERGELDIVALLVGKGAKIDAVMQDQRTPLHLASGRRGSLDVVKFLVDKGANVNAANKDGNTPFALACISCNPEIAEFLVKNNKKDVAKENIDQVIDKTKKKVEEYLRELEFRPPEADPKPYIEYVEWMKSRYSKVFKILNDLKTNQK